jgi:hypothetical protein
VAFAEDAGALAKLAADRELAPLLLACPELDLSVGPEGVTLEDPTRLNLGALMDPVAALETDGRAVARASIVAHERVIALLERVARRLGPDTAYRWGDASTRVTAQARRRRWTPPCPKA